jgi:hypothetical protein
MDFTQQQSDVIAAMQMALAKLEASDPDTLKLFASDDTSAPAGRDT